MCAELWWVVTGLAARVTFIEIVTRAKILLLLYGGRRVTLDMMMMFSY